MEDLEAFYYKKVIENFRRYIIHPCTEDDIEYLEQEFQYQLPLAFKKFLLWAGRENAGLFGDLVRCLFSTVLSQGEARELIREKHLPQSILPKDAIIIDFNPQGYAFLFLTTTEGNDPPVWSFTDGASPNTPFAKISDSFWQFLYNYAAFDLKTCHKIEVSEECSDYYEGVQNLVDLNIKKNIQRSVKGCSEVEIIALEREYRHTFPKSYRQFLQWAGNGAIHLFEPSHWTPELSITYLRSDISSNKPPIPDDGYIIRVYYSKDFDFFRFSEGDDPPIYHCEFTTKETPIYRIADTFSDYVVKAIEKLK